MEKYDKYAKLMTNHYRPVTPVALPRH